MLFGNLSCLVMIRFYFKSIKFVNSSILELKLSKSLYDRQLLQRMLLYGEIICEKFCFLRKRKKM